MGTYLSIATLHAQVAACSAAAATHTLTLLCRMCGRQVICTKVRDGDKRIVRLKEGVAKGRHVVIVDDLVQSGGTLIECQRLLTTQAGLLPLPLGGIARLSSYPATTPS